MPSEFEKWWMDASTHDCPELEQLDIAQQAILVGWCKSAWAAACADRDARVRLEVAAALTKAAEQCVNVRDDSTVWAHPEMRAWSLIHALIPAAASALAEHDAELQSAHAAALRELGVTLNTSFQKEIMALVRERDAYVQEQVAAERREHNYFYSNPLEPEKPGFYYCLCGWEGPDRKSYWEHAAASPSGDSGGAK